MSWPSFKRLSEANRDSASKKNVKNLQPKRKKRVAKPKNQMKVRKVYEPWEIHISDFSDDDQNTGVFLPNEKQKEELDSENEVIIDCSSDECSCKTSCKDVTKLTASKEKVPVKINELTSDCNKSTTSNAVSGRGVNSHIISDNNIEHCHTKTSSPQKPFQGSEQTQKRDEIGAYTKANHSGNNSAYLHLNYGDIRKQGIGKQLSAKKGGYLEKMRRIINSRYSDHVFWNREREVGLDSPGCNAVVKRVDTSYGKIIGTLAIEGKEVQVIFFNNVLEYFLSEGLKLKVSLEGEPLHVQGAEVYLSTIKVCKA